MRSKEIDKAIKLLKTYENKLVYEIGNKDKIAVDTALNYISYLEKLPDKIRDKIKVTEKEIDELMENGDVFNDNVSTYNDLKFKIEVLEEILGE